MSGAPMTACHCEAFRAIVRHWMDALPDGFLPPAEEAGKSVGAYRLTQRTEERARLLTPVEVSQDEADGITTCARKPR
ncbi:MAG: hypothetical protein GX418_08015 [Clostridiales bacterium]|nr:hypothetical protein [Clostridiales bacterium]